MGPETKAKAQAKARTHGALDRGREAALAAIELLREAQSLSKGKRG